MITSKHSLKGKIDSPQKINGKINASIVWEYPELEDIEITPTLEEQSFKANSYGYNRVTVKKIQIKQHYLEGENLILVFEDGSTLSVDISEYINNSDEETNEIIQAINEMALSIDNDELVLIYNEEILNVDFRLENENLIVDNNMNNINFNINENNELEVVY